MCKPLLEKPYMQRPGGSADGADLKAKGLKGVGLGKEAPKTEVDLKYEKEAKTSSGFSLPWTSESLKNIGKTNKVEPSKPVSASTPSKKVVETTKTKDEPPKKGFFGLF